MRKQSRGSISVRSKRGPSAITVGRALRPSLKFLFACSTALFTTAAWADDGPLPRNTYGGVGLIEMPSARMAPDGELSAGGSYFRDTQRYSLNFQFLPWLETSFRYSGLGHFDPNPVYYDRSFEVKLRVMQESDYLPAIAVGINDLVGTGVYTGEYLVASKQLGPFDATFGLGWGRLASADGFRNPLTLISSRFNTRPSQLNQNGGQFNLSDYFAGDKAGAFGGVAWRTPLTGLTLLAEYSSDSYQLERSHGQFTPRNQVNIGGSYQLSDSIALGMYYLYGRSLAGNISMQLDPVRSQYPSRVDVPPLPPVIRSDRQQTLALSGMLKGDAATLIAASYRPADGREIVDRLMDAGGYQDVRIQGRTLVLIGTANASRQACATVAALIKPYNATFDTIVMQRGGSSARVSCAAPHLSPADMPSHLNDGSPKFPLDAASGMRAIRAEAAKQHIQIEALQISGGVATVYYLNPHYFSEAAAVGRLIRILMADAPASVEKFRIVTAANIPSRTFEVLRSPMERDLDMNASDVTSDHAVSLLTADMRNPVLAIADHRNFPRFDWDIYPQMRESLFDITNPFAIQLLGAVGGTLQLNRGLDIYAEVEADLYDNFNRNPANFSALPPVRTGFINYFRAGKNGIGALKMDYRTRFSPQVFATFKAGYLESMFGGVGGEVLWRPDGQRWALGADAYEVQQRGFTRLFNFQTYRAFTGHVSLYYASPWYDMNFALSAGQYLAGDRGLSFQVTRRFSTGVEIGAFMTKTNVPAAKFGEGSFDKGLIIRIPISWVAPINTQQSLNFDLRPLQRDGGQRLNGDATLYEETRYSSEAELSDHFDDFAAPN